jgi:hypothetical protein
MKVAEQLEELSSILVGGHCGTKVGGVGNN